MDEFYVLVLCIIVTIITIWYVKGRENNMIPPLPPGPKGLPVVGYLPFLGGTDLLRHFTQLGHKYGPIFNIYLGQKPCIIISSTALAKEILLDKDFGFCDRDVSIASHICTFGGYGIGMGKHDDPQWRAVRKMLVQELMSSKRIDASYGLRRNEVRKAVGEVYAAAKAGKAVDVGELASRVAVNLMMNMLWGGTVDGEEGLALGRDFRALIHRALDLAGAPNVSDCFPALARFDIQGVKKRAEDYVRSMGSVLEGVISKSKNRKNINDDEKKKDFLQLLIEFVERPNSEISITGSALKATIVDIIMGGTDTTASGAEWAMTELLMNPDVMAKAQKELYEKVGLNNIVEESHIPNLKYLEAVIKETLRLHSTVPMLVPRTPTRPNMTLGGYSIPNNSKILVNVWSIHRDPSVWDSPMEFRPDRFLQEKSTVDFGSDKYFEYIPFGSGKRSCPGKPLADRMVVFLLASLLHSFDWRVAPGEKLDISETFSFALRKTAPLLSMPSPRLLGSHLYN